MDNSKIHEALMAVQSELKAPKGQMNKFGGYKYRSCEDILEAVKRRDPKAARAAMHRHLKNARLRFTSNWREE